MEDKMTIHAVSCNPEIEFKIDLAATFDVFRGISIWGSVGLLQPSFLAAIFNFHGYFGQKSENYLVNTLRLSQTNLLFGNLAPRPVNYMCNVNVLYGLFMKCAEVNTVNLLNVKDFSSNFAECALIFMSIKNPVLSP
jgi:hypothetical protein